MTVLYSFVSLISPLAIFIACIYYAAKQLKTDSVLLLIGSAISVLVTVFYTILMPYLIESQNLPVTNTSIYYTTASVISFFGGISFAAGLLLLIYNTVNSMKNFPKSFPPNEFE